MVRKGLAPFDQLRKRLAAVRKGSAARVEGTYPAEVQPLVNELNALLAHRERVVRRSQSKAGNLAHGLKTPLAILCQDVERVEASGNHDLAAAMNRQVERMRRQIEFHLGREASGGGGAALGVHCSVKDSVEGLSRTLRRLYIERGLTIDVDVAAEHSVRVQREDLEEMLGNLLDNACKWGRRELRIGSSRNGESVVINVDDDGPGIDPAMRSNVLQRGVRADDGTPGSGLGLAIVCDLVELYNGSIRLEDSPLGGLRAQLRLPC
jgi:signal transduction histidine kinase